MRHKLFAAAAALAVLMASAGAEAQSVLHIGLRDDPGTLDPATNATFVGRIALQAACDKLVDIDPKGQVVPMLASSWQWSADSKTLTFKLRDGVTFQDGTPFDADAVKFNLDRYLTMKGSRRRAEIDDIASVDVVDPMTVKLTLKAASVALLSQFTDRAGMMVSPTAYKAEGPDGFANKPVCAGPYQVVDYKPQQPVELKKFDKYWNAAHYHFDQIEFDAVTDSNVRLLNLRSGQLDLIENVSPNDIPSIKSDASLAYSVGAQPAYEVVQFNLSGPNANPDFAKHPEVRQAFSLALDRAAINQVVFNGFYDAGNQDFPPSSIWYDKDFPVQPGNVDAAKAKMAAAGVTSTKLDLLISTSPERLSEAQVMKQMLAPVGIDLNIVPTEFVAMRTQAASGNFQAYIVGSSGHTDPDLNIGLLLDCGQANNVGKYCDKTFDDLLAQGRAESDDAKRKAIYDKATAQLMADMPAVFLYNPKGVYAFKSSVTGFTPYPDGIIRLSDIQMSAN